MSSCDVVACSSVFGIEYMDILLRVFQVSRRLWVDGDRLEIPTLFIRGLRHSGKGKYFY